MVHRNYHEVSGATPAECGSILGRLFGRILAGYIADARDDETWPERRRDAEPLLAQTARYFPAYFEELSAYAKAAGVSLIDLWTISIEDELEDDDTEKCTTVITNNGRLIAHNEDWDADAADDICILKKRCGDVTTLELYYYGCPLGGTALSICSNGYVQAINSLSLADWRVGVPKIVLARRMAEISNVKAELEEVLSVPRSSGFTHNLVDRNGRTTVVECTARRHSVRHPETPAVHTNHVLQRDLARFEGDHDGKSTFRRYETAYALVRPHMDEREMIRLLSDEGASKTNSVFNRNTIARAIVDLDRNVASFWLRRESQRGWIEYPLDFIGAAGLVA